MSEHWIHNPTVSIIILSLVVNFLVLPMYKQADAMQAEEREKEKALEKWTKHIKETFKGDERFMMLQTYYRQENYKQLYVLKSSIPLLLQVPFFMAAYNFLSHLKYLDGVSLGPIKNLAEPDALITIGAISINFLPILMTTINIIAGAIYSKGFPLKTKIQMNGIAIVFLVLLYNSPAGLVFYWTLNNVFSLVKNIVVAVYNKIKTPVKKTARSNSPKSLSTNKYVNGIFWFSTMYLAFLIGFALPTDTIKENAQEYINLANYFSPLDMLRITLFTSIGVFILWLGIFYLLAKDKNKKYFAASLASLALVATYNVLSVKYWGVLSINFRITPAPNWSLQTNFKNVMICTLLVLVVYAIWRYKRSILMYIGVTLFVTSIVWGITNYRVMYKDVGSEYFLADNYCVPADIKLSKNGKNVVVIMMDRAVGAYYPYITNNNTIVADSFADFTYYPNTISYGGNTIFGAPALYGGPDYTVENINLSKDLSMKDKMNQSLLVMPIIFSNNGYDVTFANPTYAGYEWIPDLSIFDDYDVNAYITNGAFAYEKENYKNNSDEFIASQIRNLFCYSATKCMPTILVEKLFDQDYYAIEYDNKPKNNLVGFDTTYVNSLTTLNNLPAMTTIVPDASNNVFIMSNDLTHTALFQKSERYENGIEDAEGNSLTITSNVQIATYQTNEMAYEILSTWIEYLKENNVYDNTRIIIVSDHGYSLHHPETNTTETGWDLMAINPILLVKDFNSKDGLINESFMSNAAVPYLAMEGLIDNPINPFTGNPISLEYLNSPQLVIDSRAIMPKDNPHNTYEGGQWFEVIGETFDNFDLIPVDTP